MVVVLRSNVTRVPVRSPIVATAASKAPEREKEFAATLVPEIDPPEIVGLVIVVLLSWSIFCERPKVLA